MMEHGKIARSPSPEEEGAEETMCDELTTSLVPYLPALLGGKEIKTFRNCAQEEGRGEGKMLQLSVFISSYPTLI